MSLPSSETTALIRVAWRGRTGVNKVPAAHSCHVTAADSDSQPDEAWRITCPRNYSNSVRRGHHLLAHRLDVTGRVRVNVQGARRRLAADALPEDQVACLGDADDLGDPLPQGLAVRRRRARAGEGRRRQVMRRAPQ
jgi:hypothetical protein